MATDIQKGCNVEALNRIGRWEKGRIISFDADGTTARVRFIADHRFARLLGVPVGQYRLPIRKSYLVPYSKYSSISSSL